MKIAGRILSIVVLAALAVLNMGCDGGSKNKPSVQETQFNQLKGTWALTTANDGSPRLDFPNLVLTVSGAFTDETYNYSFTGTRPNPSPWPQSGTWKFGADPEEDIIRDPGTSNETNMKYSVTATGLLISFTVPAGSAGFPGGRVESVAGAWTFEFSKQ
jgi:hypothetical protein